MARRLRRKQYDGLLVIGDPHIEGRQPGFRCDDYPNVILDKVQWCLNYALGQNLLPVFLGDFFDKPRDNSIWLIGRLIEMMLPIEVIGVYGNHDCADASLSENDSLSILIKSGCLHLVSEDDPWLGHVGGRPVMVGGSSFRQPIPSSISIPGQKSFLDAEPLVVWLAHHDIAVPGYDGVCRVEPFEIQNVDLLINGHIHIAKDPIQAGKTLWLTPGNISRRSRKEAIRDHVPKALRIDVSQSSYELEEIVIPHEPHEQVFHPALANTPVTAGPSRFVAGLRELQMRRTESGAGLHQFLDQNLAEFKPAVAKEIRWLADQVTRESIKN